MVAGPVPGTRREGARLVDDEEQIDRRNSATALARTLRVPVSAAAARLGTAPRSLRIVRSSHEMYLIVTSRRDQNTERSYRTDGTIGSTRWPSGVIGSVTRNVSTA